METIDKLDITKEMLDVVIDEYLGYQRYFAAYNLAAVAEEILGKFVRVNGGKDALSLQTTQNIERYFKQWREIMRHNKSPSRRKSRTAELVGMYSKK